MNEEAKRAARFAEVFTEAQVKPHERPAERLAEMFRRHEIKPVQSAQPVKP